MAFESNNNAGESFPLKVIYGGEIRRATFSGSFEQLTDVVAKLFGLEKGSVSLKYQDDDDDKITMSSDGELQDALKLAKAKNLLRLFVDLKAPQTVLAAVGVVEQAPLYPHLGRFPFPPPHRGFGPSHHGPHHGPHGPHGPISCNHAHRGHMRGQPFHGPFRGGHHYGGHHRGHPFGFTPAVPASSNDQGNNLNNPIPVDENNNNNNVNQDVPFVSGPWAARCALKENKRAMKEQIKLMKENAVTPDDFLAIKELKHQMINECRQAKWQVKMDKHGAKWGKNEKWNEKWDEKMEKKQRKFEKMDKKHGKCDKRHKKEKKEKKEKGDRLVARHVADVTIPDNSVLPASEPVIKTWKLRNEGQTAWPADSVLQFISKKGDRINGPERVVVGSVLPEHTVDVSVPFMTPSQPGRYVSFYRMTTGDGAKFGQRVWVSFIVAAPTPSSITAGTANLSIRDDISLN